MMKTQRNYHCYYYCHRDAQQQAPDLDFVLRATVGKGKALKRSLLEAAVVDVVLSCFQIDTRTKFLTQPGCSQPSRRRESSTTKRAETEKPSWQRREIRDRWWWSSDSESRVSLQRVAGRPSLFRQGGCIEHLIELRWEADVDDFACRFARRHHSPHFREKLEEPQIRRESPSLDFRRESQDWLELPEKLSPPVTRMKNNNKKKNHRRRRQESSSQQRTLVSKCKFQGGSEGSSCSTSKLVRWLCWRCFDPDGEEGRRRSSRCLVEWLQYFQSLTKNDGPVFLLHNDGIQNFQSKFQWLLKLQKLFRLKTKKK